ncbi:MAG: hypothetical protein ACP5MH_08490 [Thermoproteus sp.]
MFLVPNLILIAVSLYVIARGIQAYRSFREARIGLFAMGQIVFAFSLLLEGLAGAVAAPGLLRPLAPLVFLSYQIMGAGLLLIAISVSPSAAYAVFLAPEIQRAGPALRSFLLLTVDAGLAAYIGAVLLYRSLQGRGSPLVAAAYLLFSASLAAMRLYGLALILRTAAAVFLAAGVTYAEAEKK